MSVSPPVEFPAFRGLSRTTAGFRAELLRAASRMGLDPEPLAAVMALESGFNAQAVNPDGGATGLIQFMPSTARALGTTTDELFRLSATAQLPFVEKFYAKVGLRGGAAPGDYYVATFMPSFIGHAGDEVIASAGQRVYESNKGLDRNADGFLTVNDVRSVLEGELSRARAASPLLIDPSVPSDASGAASSTFPLVALAAGVVFLNWKEVRKWMQKYELI